MDNFEVRKKQYLDKLSDNPEVLEALIRGNKTPQKKENLKKILNPETERALSVGEIVFSFSRCMIRLMNSFYEDNLKEIPIEENEGLKIFTDLVESYKIDSELAKREWDRIQPKKAAKILFGYIYSFLIFPDETIEFIMNKIGEVDPDALNNSLNGVQNEINKSNGDISFEDLSEEEIQKERELAEEFERLCDMYIIEPETKDKEFKKML